MHIFVGLGIYIGARMIKEVLALLLIGLTLVRWFYAWFGLRHSYGGLVDYSNWTTISTCKRTK